VPDFLITADSRPTLSGAHYVSKPVENAIQSTEFCTFSIEHRPCFQALLNRAGAQYSDNFARTSGAPLEPRAILNAQVPIILRKLELVAGDFA
jgi:hypothetical protein